MFPFYIQFEAYDGDIQTKPQIVFHNTLFWIYSYLQIGLGIEYIHSVHGLKSL